MPKVLNRHKTLGNKEPSPVYKSEYVNGKKILLKKKSGKKHEWESDQWIMPI